MMRWCKGAEQYFIPLALGEISFVIEEVFYKLFKLFITNGCSISLLNFTYNCSL